MVALHEGCSIEWYSFGSIGTGIQKTSPPKIMCSSAQNGPYKRLNYQKNERLFAPSCKFGD